MRPRAALFLPLLVFAAASARAQVNPAGEHEVNRPAPLVVMNLAAHPDDEDGATMAYYRHVKDAVVYSVIFTRGEGGQNEIGPELYERLGAIRTAETEAAARVLGTQVFYLNLYDFGFTKWASEAFAEWSRPRRGFWDTDHPVVGEEAGRDSVTARLVYLIRLLRPDVIFTNHDTVTVGPRTQHGQHQAVGLSAWDAFSLAADSSYHPEQLDDPYAELWQPQRLFVRTRPGNPYDVAVPTGVACGASDEPATTCSDLATRAASLHRSQGFDLLAPRFPRRDTSYFVLYRSAPGTPALPEGADDLTMGLTLPRRAPARFETPMYIASGRDRPLPGGVEADVGVAVPGQRIGLRWEAPPPEAGRDLVVFSEGGYARFDAAAGAASLDLPASDTAAVSPTLPRHRRQYDRLNSPPPLLYEVQPGTLRTVWIGDRGTSFTGYVPLEIAPPVVVDLAPAPVRLVRGENVLPVAVRTYDPAAEAVSVRLSVQPVHPEDARFYPPVFFGEQALAPADTAAVFRFTLPAETPVGRYRVVVEATASPTSAPAEPYVETRPAALLPEIRVAEGLRVGFVRSYDATTEDALRAMGAEVVPLDSAALAAGRFDGLHTVVLDIRAYLARPDLRAHNDRLLDWVRRGGHLVVGYQKTFEWNPGAPDPTRPDSASAVNPDFAPYPLVLGRDRVVREDAPVTVLDPGHTLFRAPHAITPEDWDGWVQERGLYFPATYAPRYRELLATSDPGEAPLRGGLLLAEVGAGTYLYSPLVWYRQLEALNPGAWRLFANLVSLPLADGRAAPGTR